MNKFSISENVLNQLVDAALRGAGASALPVVDALRKEVTEQISVKATPEVDSIINEGAN